MCWLTRHIFNLDMRGVEFRLQRRGHGFRRYAGRVRFGGGLGVGRCGHGEVRARGGGVETWTRDEVSGYTLPDNGRAEDCRSS